MLNKLIKDEKAIEKTAEMLNKGFHETPKVVGGLIAAGIIADKTMNDADIRKAKKQEKELKKEHKEELKDLEGQDLAYASMEDFDGFVQNLWAQRNKHSRSWGGRIY